MGSYIIRYFIARLLFEWARTVWRNPPDRFARFLGHVVPIVLLTVVLLFMLGLLFAAIL